MTLCDSYIVRIYRRDSDDPSRILGVVEIVETGEVKKFAGNTELNTLLCGLSKEQKPQAKIRKPKLERPKTLLK